MLHFVCAGAQSIGTALCGGRARTTAAANIELIEACVLRRAELAAAAAAADIRLLARMQALVVAMHAHRHLRRPSGPGPVYRENGR